MHCDPECRMFIDRNEPDRKERTQKPPLWPRSPFDDLAVPVPSSQTISDDHARRSAPALVHVPQLLPELPMRYQKVSNKPGLRIKPLPGTTVRFSGFFLAATGQHRAAAQRWRVIECACERCAGGTLVAVNEPSVYSHDDPDTRGQWRHIAFRNLERVEVAVDDCPTRPAGCP